MSTFDKKRPPLSGGRPPSQHVLYVVAGCGGTVTVDARRQPLLALVGHAAIGRGGTVAWRLPPQ
jgi:hypothetical protein